VVVVSTVWKPRVWERARVSATTPGAASEYSRGSRASQGGVPVPPGLRAALWLAAIGGPILLVVADFTTLLQARGQDYVRAVSGHANHSYAMVAIGLLALAIALFAVPRRTPAGLPALVALGLAAAVVALAFDLPEATGTKVLSTAQGLREVSLTPRVGFYLETLGAALLLVAGVGGLLLAAPALPRRRGGDES
jgi:multisubunit Na+/H+ antiporter MnhB subunit